MKSLDVMVVDDEPAIRQVLSAHLRRSGHRVCQAGNGTEALERLQQGDIEVAISDIKMPDFSGIELVRRARAAGIDTSFVMMTAYASVDTAIEAIRAGACDYMIKPVRNEEVLHRLERVGDLRGLRDQNQVLRSMVLGTGGEAFTFESPAMQDMNRLIAKVAPSESTVLITGESGTGKGVIARHIHQASPRAAEAFLPVNCGAIPGDLIESELFGHTRGAFTGAARSRKGLFLEADKGTVFLDEIGELPLHLQVKLLHVFDASEVRPVGSEQAKPTDVRIITATNRDLRQMVAEGRFREDLYFRLSAFHVHVPPLRERREDLPGLVRFLIRRAAVRMKIAHEISVDPDADEVLMAYHWPGNVRELENVLDHALIVADRGCISVADLPAQMASSALDAVTTPGSGSSLRDQVRSFENTLIHKAISDANGDRRLAALKLRIGLSSLYRKLEEYGDHE